MHPRSPLRSALAALFLPFSLLAQSFAGEWRGEIKVPGSPLAITVRFTEAATGLNGTIDIPAQGAKDLPLTAIAAKQRTLTFAIADTPGNPTFQGTLADDGNTLAGPFTQGTAKLTFTLQRAAAAQAQARANFDGFQAWLDETRAMFDVPGCAVAIVKGDELVATFASGERDLATHAKVDADTLFAIGSSTKAFTTCLLAMLADDGRLQWDEPVRRWLPEFALADAPLSERITPRDLVTHRSGMPRHDLVWYGATFERRDMVARLRHLPLNHDLRTDFQYNNLMFLTAGHLAERIGGAAWEEQVKQRILVPLAMPRACFTVGAMQQDGNHARPFRREHGKVGAIPFRDITAIGPAGSINASVKELAHWLTLHLRHGEFGGKRLLAAATADDLHTVRMPLGGAGDDETTIHVGYALGWFVDVYRGHREVHHGGNIDGFSALVAMLPDSDFGFAVLTNLDGTPLPGLVVKALADRALALAPIDHRTPLHTRLRAAEAEGEKAKAAAATTQRTGTSPSHALDDYAGDYAHPGYGACRVTRTADGLRIDFHGLGVDLAHWHYDVFVGKENSGEAELAGTKVQFTTDFDGDIDAVRAVLEPATPPIVFARQPEARLRDAAFLQRLVGRYDLKGAVATVTLQKDRLVVSLPGQRYELEPRRGLRFSLQGLSGYAIEFVLDGDKVTGARFHQPDGTHEATRKD